jgi:hypothetical protein
MSPRALQIAIRFCDGLLLVFAVLTTVIALDAEPAGVKLAFLGWTMFCVGYTLIQRLRMSRRRKALLSQ